MKFITVRDLRTSPAQIWKQLPQEQEMVITNNGKPIALLTPLSDIDLEDNLSAVRRARAIIAVSKMQRISSQENTALLSQEEINREIFDTRREIGS
ncbi:MAG: type II toxin-antitoxin system Phd/YefM family antitoxin [Spirochaetaceae bacterium]|nr:type II toxin-antitoxin system Phd/YefM family antitoxin [Spirochaetaceae bacterium]